MMSSFNTFDTSISGVDWSSISSLGMIWRRASVTSGSVNDSMRFMCSEYGQKVMRREWKVKLGL